jgi:hypothetical protein
MIKDVDDLTLKEKHYHIDRLLSLNDLVRQKVLHIFISFHETDKIDKDTMRKLARDYMEGMGWDKQPYLVYLHHDALYTHLHIVSSRIRRNDLPIYMYRSNVLKSYELSRQLEKRYGLFQAGVRIPDEEWANLHPVQTLEKGVTSLRPTMNAVLESVIPQYNYTTLEEFNALLGLYRMRASLGEENGSIRNARGLLYVPLTEDGKETRPYVKASFLRQQPTLKVLEARFAVNRELRKQLEERVTTAIDWVLLNNPLDLANFKEALANERISVVLERKADQPKIWYVDHQSRSVHTGESLGPRYSAEGLLKRLVPEEVYQQHLKERLALEPRRGQRISGDL